MKSTIKVYLILLVLLTFSIHNVQADPNFPLPRMPICGDQDDPSNPIVYHCADLIPIPDVQVFRVPEGEVINLVFDFVFREATYNNELGFFKVEDSSGVVEGIYPGEPGYIAAAMAKAEIIFQSGSNAYTPDVIFEFYPGEVLVFFIIQNSTLRNFLLNNPDNVISKSPLAFFSLDILNPDMADHFVGFDSTSDINTQFGFEDMTDGGDRDYDDVVYNIIPPMDPSPDLSWYGQYYNNRDLTGNPVFTRSDKKIDFYWGTSSPDNTVPIDNFSIHWRRLIEIDKTGWYRFRTFSDDGIRLYIDGKLIIDDWVGRSFAERSAGIELVKGLHNIDFYYVEWEQDAMVHLTWYLCPNGESDCDLNIDPMYQTQYLTSPMPSDCATEENQTIARWGCAITSVVMALQNYGINTTPSDLNEWLSSKGTTEETYKGYSGGECTAYLIWDSILEFAKEPENGELSLAWKTSTDAKSVIREGYPIIMDVAGGHYVLGIDAIEVDGIGSVGINDPHHSWSCAAGAADPSLPPASILNCTNGALKHATTIIEEKEYFGQVTPSRFLAPLEEPRTASLQLEIHGVEVLLHDPFGRRVGYSNQSGNYYSDIPNSMYYDSEIIPPNGQSRGIIQRTLYLPEHAQGTYMLMLSTPMNSNNAIDEVEYFSIKVFGYDALFNRIDTMISGNIDDGQTLVYIIKYSPGSSLVIDPAKQLFLPALFH